MRVLKSLTSALVKHREAVDLSDELWRYWADHLDVAYQDESDDTNTSSTYFSYGHKGLAYAGPAWDFELQESTASAVNRCEASMLKGPLFVSEQYPWPTGRQGKPLAPVLQFDLRIATGIQRDSGLFEHPVDFGDGLLQVWFDNNSISDAICRVVPRSQVDPKELLPIPGDLYPAPRCQDFIDVDWTEGAPVSVIKSLRPPRFTIQSHFGFDVDPRVFPRRFRPKCRRLSDLLTWLEGFPADASGHHLFGTFYGVQYSADEMPTCFLQLDSYVPFLWGDSGTAQVFYEVQTTGEIKFSFDWSCY